MDPNITKLNGIFDTVFNKIKDNTQKHSEYYNTIINQYLNKNQRGYILVTCEVSYTETSFQCSQEETILCLNKNIKAYLPFDTSDKLLNNFSLLGVTYLIIVKLEDNIDSAIADILVCEVTNIVPHNFVKDVNQLREDILLNARTSHKLKANNCLQRTYKNTTFFDDMVNVNNDKLLQDSKSFIFCGKFDNNTFNALIKVPIDYLTYIELKLDHFIDTIKQNRKMNIFLTKQINNLEDSVIVMCFNNSIDDPKSIEYHCMDRVQINDYIGTDFDFKYELNNFALIVVINDKIINDKIIKMYSIPKATYIINNCIHRTDICTQCLLCDYKLQHTILSHVTNIDVYVCNNCLIYYLIDPTKNK